MRLDMPGRINSLYPFTSNTPPQIVGQDCPPAGVHLDLDGLTDIYKVHGWDYPHAHDPASETGLLSSLEFCERNGLRATLFVIANSLDDPRKLELVQEAVHRGHEIASHSLTHANLWSLNHEQKRREISESRDKLEKLLGIPVCGFRAPGYRIDHSCIALLEDYGYAYDTSVLPDQTSARHLQVPVSRLTRPQRGFLGTTLVEMPLPSYRPLPFPFNPSYALLLGMKYFYLGLHRFAKRQTPLVLLFHLIDFADPVPSAWLPGLKARIFTLSNMSGAQKRESCQRMLDAVRQRYRLLSTAALLTEPALC